MPLANNPDLRRADGARNNVPLFAPNRPPGALADGGNFKDAGLRRRADLPLIDQFPPFVVKRAYFHEIPVPDLTSFRTGDAAWFPLRRIRVPEDLGSEVLLVGVGYQILPTNPNGADVLGTGRAGAVRTAWGDSTGSMAALVVDKNLPVKDNAWNGAPAFLPGINGDLVAAEPDASRITQTGQAEYAWCSNFPPGTIDATSLSMLDALRQTLPVALPISGGDTLDVAFVCKGTQIANASGSTKFVLGRAHVWLYLAPTEGLRSLAP